VFILVRNIGPFGVSALHGTKCPLLTAFFPSLSFFLSSGWVTFLPEGIFLSNKNVRNPTKMKMKLARELSCRKRLKWRNNKEYVFLKVILSDTLGT
jgi:hypothetical protein